MNRQEAITTGCSSELAKALDGLHEISQPLTALCLGLYLLEAANGADERDKLLTSIQDECNRAVRGVQRLRDLMESSWTVSPAQHSSSGQALRGERVGA